MAQRSMIYSVLIVDLLCAEANNVAILLFLVVACLMRGDAAAELRDRLQRELNAKEPAS